MAAYGWSFLLMAIAMAGLGIVGDGGPHAFGANLMAVVFLLLSLITFAAIEHDERG